MKSRAHQIAVAVIALALPFNAYAAEERGDCMAEVRQQQEAIMRQHVDDSVKLASSTYPEKEKSFGELSCLDNIMNSGSDIFFSPPSLGDLMGKIKGAACGVVDQQYSNLTSGISTNAGIPLGDAIPGVNLGSVGLGGSISQNQSQPLDSNITQSVSKAKNDFNALLGTSY